jgi:hypothetical protein
VLKFRPQQLSKRILIKERRYGKNINYNFVSRDKWFPAGWGYNQKILGSIFSKLHYLACHSPEPIQKKWSKSYKNFEKAHLGDMTGRLMSIKYANNWSCGKWL